MGNGYMRIARLGSHPAFSFDGTDAAPLRCPLCGEFFGRVPEYDKHFINHEPTQEQAYNWLSGRSYDKLATKKGWAAS